MKLLLDTHVWLWALLNPSLLRPKVRRDIEDPGTELWLSTITLWETALLIEKQRIQISSEPSLWIKQAVDRSACNEIQINTAVALRSRTIQLPHQDPADRFIAASAEIFDLVLVTADQRLLACPDIKTSRAAT
ncbi:MAG: type II toxin-antitoxin system VapC family toxin [Pseudomonadota bacterium]